MHRGASAGWVEGPVGVLGPFGMCVPCGMLGVRDTKGSYGVRLEACVGETKTSIVSTLKVPIMNVQNNVTPKTAAINPLMVTEKSQK